MVQYSPVLGLKKSHFPMGTSGQNARVERAVPSKRKRMSERTSQCSGPGLSSLLLAIQNLCVSRRKRKRNQNHDSGAYPLIGKQNFHYEKRLENKKIGKKRKEGGRYLMR